MHNLTGVFRQQEMPASNDVSICRKWMEVTGLILCVYVLVVPL